MLLKLVGNNRRNGGFGVEVGLRPRVLGIIAGSVGLAALLIVGASAMTGMPVYTVHETLDSNPNVPFKPNDWFTVSFSNTQGTTIARLELLIPSGVVQASNNSIPIMVSVWHIDGTWLDSLKLTFYSDSLNVGPDVWFKSPGGTLSSTVLVYKDHGSAVVDIPNMGFMGSGTVTFDLIVHVYRNTPITQSYPLSVQTEMGLSDSGYIGGYSPTHDYNQIVGFPLIGRSLTGQVLLAFSVDPNGNVSKVLVVY